METFYGSNHLYKCLNLHSRLHLRECCGRYEIADKFEKGKYLFCVYVNEFLNIFKITYEKIWSTEMLKKIINN
ncbi:CLUMA_CG015670, isoform A [Clunio marinus]|uniref:CLUMA_CG015670, isoform A n=1 Tax=Clunio marinus TaxID=568069 RepID=A0A1J1IPY4_9DIPT|nr:CLUMA_CG015670, isoform A [Clunio marinus]